MHNAYGMCSRPLLFDIYSQVQTHLTENDQGLRIYFGELFNRLIRI